MVQSPLLQSIYKKGLENEVATEKYYNYEKVSSHEILGKIL